MIGGEYGAVVLTGFNTDIEYSGTTYHVQTEDKGRANPLVESLVYTSGEILYTRRTPYHDLLAENVDSGAIATLMERQHRTIVQAVQTGGVERLTGAVEIPVNADDTTITRGKAPRPAPALAAPRGCAHHAACSGDRVGKALYRLVGAIMGVRTRGMWIVVKSMLSAAYSGAAQALKASSAPFEAT